MGVDEAAHAVELCEQHADADFVGPRPEALIATAEAAPGVSFPPSYRLFLLQLGAGSVAGVDGMGGEYVLDTTKGSEPPVEVWEGGASTPDDPLEVVADDFGAFLLDKVGSR